jgi:Spy/CpxP family protein refolding chaperone
MYTWSTGPTFGVRRPLRHLSWKLDLTEAQVRELADVLNRLKTAYAQARLDRERSVADVAASFDAEVFDTQRAREALDGRKDASTALNDEVLAALERIFESLDADQRREFAYLLRSGEFHL